MDFLDTSGYDRRLMPAPSGRPSSAGAILVAIGIFVSRIFGLVRVRVFSHYFGLASDAADAFNAAFRIPNLLQNLFGEGALSGSFIPVYAKLLATGDEEEADRVAGAVAGLLALAVSTIVLVGVLATPILLDLIAPGFEGAKRDLTIHIVRILFPGAGLLVLSAWCLGILNSHHRFFLSYAAPVMWNVAMIATLVGWGGRLPLDSLAIALAWGSVAGSGLQVLVQWPTVARVTTRLRLSLGHRSAHVREVVRNFWPVFFSRGVVQISAYVDQMIASLLPTGAVTGLTNVQLLYTLPVSLFGMSVSAAELPAMSRAVGDEAAVSAQVRERLARGLEQIAFFVVPSAVAFATLGDVVAATILQTGRFGHADALYVWGILAGSSVGLLASTSARLYSSTYWALRDTRTPLRYAIVRVALTAVLGFLAAVFLPAVIGVETRWGAAGLTASAGLAGWVEFFLLRRTLTRRIGRVVLPRLLLPRLWSSALAAAAIAWTCKLTLPQRSPLLEGLIVLVPYGAAYLGLTTLMGLSYARRLAARLRPSQ
ncbi:MAG TPA: murein biosynthesis integral membrane protein MurJ [Vicinamibacterales bacterium]